MKVDGDMTPDPVLVREQLERILGSGTFATAGRHSRLLRYLVERTLAGEGEQLKEYVLGTEVFDRSDAYDPRIDSIVRVEVRRLRSRLEEYYRATGARDSVVITIPRGSYIPSFALRSHSEVTGVPLSDGDSLPPRATDGSPVAMITAALIIASVVLAASFLFERDRTPAQAASGPGVAVLPFEHYSADAADALVVAQLTDEVTAALAQLGTVSVVSRTSAARYSGAPRSIVEIAKALNVNYLIEAGASSEGDHIRIVARLVDGVRDRKIWVGEYELNRTEIAEVAKRIATDAATALQTSQPPQAHQAP